MKKENGVLSRVRNSDIALLRENPKEFWEDVVSIGESAFEFNEKLETIEIPSTIKEIGEYAFSSCEYLKEVVLPEGLQIMDKSLFEFCPALEKVVIPSTVKEIKEEAFLDCKKIEEIILPQNLEKIDSRAFSGCSNIKAIEIPSKIKKIPYYAFFGCSKLEKVVLPEGLEKIDTQSFVGCSSLETIEIPSTVKEIGPAAFVNCRKLSNVILNEGLEKIEYQLFVGCKSLERIEIPSTVKEIGVAAFNSCKNLKEVILTEGLEKIEYEAFSNCINLEKIEIPSTVRKIGKDAFSGCNNLKKVTLPEGLEEMVARVFAECENLEKIEAPSTLKIIGAGTFYNCNNLKEVTLHEGLQTIENSAFYRCNSLERIEIPSTVKSIEYDAFYGCNSLKELTLPEGLEEIHRLSFGNCKNLEKASIPQSVKTVADKAFSGCDNLKEIVLPTSPSFNVDSLCPPHDFGYISILNDKHPTHPGGYIISKEKYKNSNVTETYNINDYVAFTHYSYNTMIENIKSEDKLVKKSDIAINNLLLKNKMQLPYKFVEALADNRQLQHFIDNATFKAFRTVQKLIPKNLSLENSYSFYTFAYNIGCFSNDKTLANKACTWLEARLTAKKGQEPDLSFDKMNRYFPDWEPTGENEEFSEFLFGKDDRKKITTFEELKRESNMGKLIKKIYDEYRNPQSSLGDGGRFRNEKGKLMFRFGREIVDKQENKKRKPKDLKPTVDVFKEYFAVNSFDGVVTDQQRQVAKELGKWNGITQTMYEDAIRVLERMEAKNIPINILGEHLKEIISDTEQYKNKTEGLAKSGLEEAKEVVDKLSDIVRKEFTYDWLEKNDPIGFVLGYYCNCCASLADTGEGIALSSFLNPDVQNLVIRDENGIPVAKGTFYINREQGYGVFNNFEVANHVLEHKEEIYAAFMRGIDKFEENYNAKNPDNPLKRINVGMRLNDLEEQVKNGGKPSEILQAIDFGDYSISNRKYMGDWSREGQYTIKENKNSR